MSVLLMLGIRGRVRVPALPASGGRRLNQAGEEPPAARYLKATAVLVFAFLLRPSSYGGVQLQPGKAAPAGAASRRAGTANSCTIRKPSGVFNTLVAVVATLVATLIGTLAAFALRASSSAAGPVTHLDLRLTGTAEIVMGVSLTAFNTRRARGPEHQHRDPRPHHVLHRVRGGGRESAPVGIRQPARRGGRRPRRHAVPGVSPCRVATRRAGHLRGGNARVHHLTRRCRDHIFHVRAGLHHPAALHLRAAQIRGLSLDRALHDRARCRAARARHRRRVQLPIGGGVSGRRNFTAG